LPLFLFLRAANVLRRRTPGLTNASPAFWRRMPAARAPGEQSTHLRYLAVDLGDKRTGLALGDDVTGIVSPVAVIEVPAAQRAGESLLEALSKSLGEHIGALSAGELVVGLPVNMDGTEGPRAKRVREFGGRLGSRTGRVVHFQDERLTTSEADWAMARTGMTRGQKKAKRDALAAAAILRDFLASKDTQRRATEGGGEGLGG
jgi:putative holliday junction resolvase